jgi:hypothetical protein
MNLFAQVSPKKPSCSAHLRKRREGAHRGNRRVQESRRNLAILERWRAGFVMVSVMPALVPDIHAED